MFALKPGRVDKGSEIGFRKPLAGYVMPRMLRRPARTLARVVSGDYEPPRYASAMLCGALLAATAIYGAVVGGHVPTVISSITARTGFAVADIRVSGNRETSEIDVIGQLDLSGYTSLIGLDADKVRSDVEMLPWVRSARVRKVYPDALDISIEEREAFAVWQHGEALTVVQADGQKIAPFAGGNAASLPLIVGSGAPEQASAFVRLVAQYPDVARRATAYSLVAGRRWDIRLDNGVTVKLPERAPEAALAELVALDRQHALLSRGVASVDLRIADRIAVKLPAEEAELYRASMRDRLGIGKRPGRPT